MCKGNCVYQDSSRNTLQYFSTQGYECEIHDNPADFALDVLIIANQDENQLNKLTSAYKSSPMFLEVDENIGKQENESTTSNTKSIDERSIINELYYVGKRTLINVVRNPALFVSQIIVSLIFGLLTGLVFYQMNEDIDPGIPNRLGAIFFIVTSQIFSTITALESLLKERVLFLHVKMSNIDFNEILFDFFFFWFRKMLVVIIEHQHSF